MKTISVLALGAIAMGCASAPSAAAAPGAWRLDPRLCPDLVEDRRDQRFTVSRADRREDIRDARHVNCPASAWVWTGATPFRQSVHPARPGVTAFYVHRGQPYYYRRVGPDRVRVNVRLFVH